MTRTFRAFLATLAIAMPLAAGAQQVPLADFNKRPVYETMKISPDGKTLAAMAYVEGKRYLALVNMATMEVKAIRGSDGNELAEFWWVAPNRVVYTLGEKVAGIEKPFQTGELFAVNGDGSGNDMLYGYRKGGQQTGSRIKQVTAEYGSARVIDDLRNDDGSILVAVDSWDGGGSEGDFSKVSRMDVRRSARCRASVAPRSTYACWSTHFKNVLNASFHGDVSAFATGLRQDGAMPAVPLPDFRLYPSNALELLAALLADELRRPAPGQALLAPDIVLIPQVAMRRWLQATLASRHGIAANLEFLTPGEFVSRALRAKKSCAAPLPNGSASASLSLSRRPIVEKYSGSTASSVPSAAACSSSVRACAKLSATCGDETIWMAAIFMGRLLQWSGLWWLVWLAWAVFYQRRRRLCCRAGCARHADRPTCRRCGILASPLASKGRAKTSAPKSCPSQLPG